MIQFTVLGDPQGKQRARSTRSGHHYTPAKTANYETRLAWEFRQATLEGWVPLEKSVHLFVLAVYPIPQSFGKAKRNLAIGQVLKPTVKPDADNIAKLVADGLNGIAWVDDKQITNLQVQKAYGDTPRLVISIEGEGE